MNLILTLKEPYYSMTGEPGKMYELRRASKWINSRLFNKDGTPKIRKAVTLINGYGKHRPRKIRNIKKIDITTQQNTWILPNNEKIITEPGDIVIWLE